MILALSLLQPFIGWATDIMYNPNDTRPKPAPDLLHWVLGWAVVCLVMVQVSLGLQYLVVSTAVLVLWYIWLGLVVFVSITVAIVFYVRYKYYGFRGGAVVVDDK